MKSALLRLREVASRLSTTEREIADYLLSHPQEVVDLSIHEVAKRTFSSPSSIVRLCHHAGFSGFKEFRKAVTYELAVRDQSDQDCRQDITRNDTPEDIIRKITGKNILSLEDTKSLLEPGSLEQSVALIGKAKVIYVFGMGASLNVARDICLKLLRLNKLSVIRDDFHSQRLQAGKTTDKDLGIIVSYSGETEEMVECMKVMKDNGTPMIAITRCARTPVSELADVKLYVASGESLFRDGNMSSRVAQFNVADILYTAVANRDHDQSLYHLDQTEYRKEENL